MAAADRRPKPTTSSRCSRSARSSPRHSTSCRSTKPTDIPSSVAVLNEIGAALDTAGDKLDEIQPPSEVADSHQKLVDGAHEAADDFRGLADKLQNAKPSEVPQLLSQLNPSTLPGFQNMQEAVNELKTKGYDLGQLAS